MGYVQNFRDRVIDLLEDSGSGDIISIDYLELGSGSTPESINDTSLESPFFRKPITQQSKLSTELISIITLLENEGNSQPITEIGIYSGGNHTFGSGFLTSRIQYTTPLKKSTGNVLNIIRKDKVNI